MDVEVARLTAGMNKEREIERAGMHFCEGWIGGSEVVVVRCGIGKVNGGLCVQILCDLFDVTHVINTGIAGSLDEEINIGDVVVSIDAMYHDMDVTGLGYEPGQVPQLKVLAFPADNMLRVAAVKACREAAPEIGVFEGRVVSGDQFICERSRKDEIAATFGGLCTEMEGAAIAQTAWLNNIPFVILRSISDNANDDAGKDYVEIEAEAAAHCSAITASIIEHF
jgi:adenosylhomocysteine nucleosidase